MENIEENSIVKENVFFTPSQMFVGTLLGGILTVNYMIVKNYSALNDIKNRNLMILFGIAFFIFITLYVVHIDPKFSGIGMYAGIGAAMSAITKKLLTEKGYIKTSKNFLKCDFIEGTKLYSWWHVILASVAGFILTILFSFILGSLLLKLNLA